MCGIAPITQFDPTDLKVHLAAEVKGFVPENYMSKPEAKRMGRFTQMAVVSAKEALDGAGFTLDEAEADRCGVIVSSGIGGLSITEAEHDKGKEKGWDRVSPFYIPTGICNMAAGQIAIHTGFRGMCSCPVTACTGGTNAVGDAFHYIRDGYADVMLCGGTESAVTPLAIGAFTSMKALTQNPDPKRASIPFDAERSGFVLGEGAAILLLEELDGVHGGKGGVGLRDGAVEDQAGGVRGGDGQGEGKDAVMGLLCRFGICPGGECCAGRLVGEAGVSGVLCDRLGEGNDIADSHGGTFPRFPSGRRRGIPRGRGGVIPGTGGGQA